jgi:hypothetical protein
LDHFYNGRFPLYALPRYDGQGIIVPEEKKLDHELLRRSSPALAATRNGRSA